VKKRGRRTRLSYKLQKQICKLLAQGHAIRTVCEAVGIAERIYYDWQKHPAFFSGDYRRDWGSLRFSSLRNCGSRMIGGRKHFCWNGAGLMSLAEAMDVRCPKSRRPGQRRVARNHYATSQPCLCELVASFQIPQKRPQMTTV
jgi:hypothetical protein